MGSHDLYVVDMINYSPCSSHYDS